MPEITDEQMQNLMDWLVPTVGQMGLNLLGAILVLIIGFWIAGRIRAWIKRALGKLPRFDDMLTAFLASLAYYTAVAITILAVLQQFGVETTSFIAVLGAAGLAVGLALQGTLSNVAAGVMLLIFRPFKFGEFVEVGGHSGTVKGLNLFTTELATPENVQIIIPNSAVWGDSVKNYNGHPTRRCDITMGISYASDINKAMAVLKDVWEKDDRVLKDPEAFQGVVNLGDSSVDIVVRLWVNSADYWPVKFDLTKAFKEAFDENGIDIPFPTRTLHTHAH